MAQTKEYLLDQVKRGHVVHWRGKRCKTADDVENAWSDEPTDGAKSAPTTSKLQQARKGTKDEAK